MDIEFTEEQKMLQGMVRRLAREKIAPMLPELKKRDSFSPELLDLLKKNGLLTILVPEEFGGPGGGVVSVCIVGEELSKVYPSALAILGGHYLATEFIAVGGSKEIHEKYLTRIAAGNTLVTTSLTEPEAGSDVAAIKTRAIRDGDYYIVNGVKQFTSNAGIADLHCVFAVTNPEKGYGGISAFIVENGTDGLSIGKVEDMMGMRGLQSAQPIYEDVKVSKNNMIGPEGKGFYIAMEGFDHSRPIIGAQAVGIAQGAFEHAVRYAKERVTFGKPIAQHQVIQFMLADMATQIEAARALVYKTAVMCDTKAKDASKFASMSKYFASDVAMKVTTDAVQILGGYGYMKDYPVESLMRDAKLTQIYDGTNQIHRMVVANNILKD